MSWHFLQGQAAACWPRSSLDGAPSALSKLIPFVAKPCLRGKETAAWSPFRYGMISTRSMASPGGNTSTSFLGDSHAKASAAQGNAKVLTRRRVRYGQQCSAWSARFDHVSSSWRMCPNCDMPGSRKCSAIWPASGCLLDGVSCVETVWDALPQAPDCGLSLPRPTASIGRHGWGFVAHSKAKGRYSQRTIDCASRLSGGRWRPHITLMEWIMGWPLGWTNTAQSAMDGFQLWLRAHGIS